MRGVVHHRQSALLVWLYRTGLPWHRGCPGDPLREYQHRHDTLGTLLRRRLIRQDRGAGGRVVYLLTAAGSNLVRERLKLLEPRRAYQDWVK